MKKCNYLLLTCLFALFLFQSCTEMEVKHEEPTQLISNDVAKELNHNYNNSRHRLISESINKEDANSAWYSIKELEKDAARLQNRDSKEGYAYE